MGSKKHGTSGFAPRSPRFKHLTKLEAEGALGRDKPKQARPGKNKARAAAKQARDKKNQRGK
jgi:hypothetical protein